MIFATQNEDLLHCASP